MQINASQVSADTQGKYQVMTIYSEKLKTTSRFFPFSAIIGNAQVPSTSHLEQQHNHRVMQYRHNNQKYIFYQHEKTE